jgi:hypothetical protein
MKWLKSNQPLSVIILPLRVFPQSHFITYNSERAGGLGAVVWGKEGEQLCKSFESSESWYLHLIISLVEGPGAAICGLSLCILT